MWDRLLTGDAATRPVRQPAKFHLLQLGLLWTANPGTSPLSTLLSILRFAFLGSGTSTAKYKSWAISSCSAEGHVDA